MNVYQLLSDYMTKSAGVVQAIVDPQVPSTFKMYLASQYEVGVTLLQRILKDFDQPDAEQLAQHLDELINVQQAVQQSVDLMPPQPPPPEGGQPPPEGEQSVQQPPGA